MKRYFDTIDALDRFTLELNCHQDELQCHHCAKNDQFVSHGFVYKQRSAYRQQTVGKRIVCSNRYGHSGCGRTFRLYITNEIPALHYSAAELFLFLSALLANVTVAAAYQKATGQSETRNAWRWLTKLDRRLSDYRCFLQTRVGTITTSFKHRARRLQILLPTIKRLFLALNDCPCANYQYLVQSGVL